MVTAMELAVRSSALPHSAPHSADITQITRVRPTSPTLVSISLLVFLLLAPAIQHAHGRDAAAASTAEAHNSSTITGAWTRWCQLADHPAACLAQLTSSPLYVPLAPTHRTLLAEADGQERDCEEKNGTGANRAGVGRAGEGAEESDLPHGAAVSASVLAGALSAAQQAHDSLATAHAQRQEEQKGKQQRLQQQRSQQQVPGHGEAAADTAAGHATKKVTESQPELSELRGAAPFDHCFEQVRLAQTYLERAHDALAVGFTLARHPPSPLSTSEPEAAEASQTVVDRLRRQKLRSLATKAGPLEDALHWSAAAHALLGYCHAGMGEEKKGHQGRSLVQQSASATASTSGPTASPFPEGVHVLEAKLQASNALSLIAALHSRLQSRALASTGACNDSSKPASQHRTSNGSSDNWSSGGGGGSSSSRERVLLQSAQKGPHWAHPDEESDLAELQSFMQTHFDRLVDTTPGGWANVSSAWERLLVEEVADGRQGHVRGRRLAGAALPRLRPDIVVSQDGRGNYRTVKEAAQYVGNLIQQKGLASSRRAVIFIRRGTYIEAVDLYYDGVIFLGEGIDVTIIQNSKSVAGGYPVFNSATVGVNANRFTAMGITFRNRAGPSAGQAIALRCEGDQSAFYRCKFDGFQDTLSPSVGRQYFSNCVVLGTVDFIFGVSSSVFYNCQLYVRPWPYDSAVAASGRMSAADPSGFVFVRGVVKGTQAGSYGFLGRPWGPYARTVYINVFMTKVIRPGGWLEWSSSEFRTNWGGTPYYAEYQSSGPGGKGRRVSWAHPGIIGANMVPYFSPQNFIAASSWIASTGAPYP